jgi:hypothetical protein
MIYRGGSTAGEAGGAGCGICLINPAAAAANNNNNNNNNSSSSSSVLEYANRVSIRQHFGNTGQGSS